MAPLKSVKACYTKRVLWRFTRMDFHLKIEVVEIPPGTGLITERDLAPLFG